MYEINAALLRRRHKILLPACEPENEAGGGEIAAVLSALKNIENLGFTLDQTLIENLLTYPMDEIRQFYFDLVQALRPLVGADVDYTPMYPNFPRQVMETSAAELILNAIVHYWTYGILVPDYQKEERFPLIDDVTLEKLTAGTLDDVVSIFQNLVGSKTSLSEQDRADIAQFIADHADYGRYLPEEIPLKENAALVGKLVLEQAAIKDVTVIQKYFRTATDVLRLVTALSDGDLSLAERTRYRKLRRCERRMVMDLLAGCGDILEDLYRYPERWIRIGEIVHPGEYRAPKYDGVREAFDCLRNGKKPLFFSGQVEQALRERDTQTAAALLLTRPGEFARRLDQLLRTAEDPGAILEHFRTVAGQVSVPVLLQARQHFMDRNLDSPVRVIIPKGNLGYVVSIANTLPPLSEEICREAAGICENGIRAQLSGRAPMGRVYIDPVLKKFMVPFSQRSAGSASRTLVRGSRIPLRGEGTAVRAFIWWTNTEKERVDLDLSASLYDEDWDYLTHVSYTRLEDSRGEIFHSGDIVNGGDVDGDGAAEFIDCSLAAASEGGRYLVFQVFSYTGQRFSELPHCRFGWMEREYVDSGEIFEPATVQMSMDLQVASSVCIPVAFDCWEREFIWFDLAVRTQDVRTGRGGNNLESNLCGTWEACRAMAQLSKPNLYDLVLLNAQARGSITKDREQADIIFSMDRDESGEEETSGAPVITAFDADYFMGQLL